MAVLLTIDPSKATEINPQTAPSALLRIGFEDLAEGSGGTYDHHNPVTGLLQATIPLAGKAEIDLAVARAKAAAEAWRRWRPEARREALIKLADLIEENVGDFARLAALDGGMTLATGTEIAMLWRSGTGTTPVGATRSTASCSRPSKLAASSPIRRLSPTESSVSSSHGTVR